MEITENKLEYRKRSLVELPNGSYKIYYHINELPLVGQENMQGIMNLIGSSYNIKRLFNIVKEKEIDFDDIYKVMNILTEPTSNFLCNMGMLQKWTIFNIKIVYAKPHSIKKKEGFIDFNMKLNKINKEISKNIDYSEIESNIDLILPNK